MRLTTLSVGGLRTNCYILAPDSSDDCAVIDPGADPQQVIVAVQSAGLIVRLILCTHGHADHTGGVATLQGAAGGRFYLHSSDVAYSLDPPDWLEMALEGFVPPPGPDAELQGIRRLLLGDEEIEFIHTPGHTPGSTCFRVDDMVFTGDTLFRESIGRYDLPGGDGPQELESIHRLLLTLDDYTRVYPGHGPATTIGHEKLNNPFLRQ